MIFFRAVGVIEQELIIC